VAILAQAACINQDSANPAEQLNGSLGRIIGSCDLMVTPIFDPDWRKWFKPADDSESAFSDLAGTPKVKEIGDVFTEYLAPAFREYLSRGWCRLEMFFNANMPVTGGREKLFGGELGQLMAGEKRRPHLLFGTREEELGEMPLILRALRDTEFGKLHPAKGKLFNKTDEMVIRAYVEELFIINKNLQVQ
jgi:hypothetical protein